MLGKSSRPIEGPQQHFDTRPEASPWALNECATDVACMVNLPKTGSASWVLAIC